MAGDNAGSADEVVAALVAALRGELAESRAALARAQEDLAQARERIAELEARLRQSPRNSSRPPSGEGLDKPPPRPRSLRTKTGRKPGGQDGHEGSTLAQVARPDRELRHEPGRCGWCGAGLSGRPVTGVERRQVFDLPEAAVAVTEHQLIERACGCGQRTRAAAPPGGGAGAVRAADRGGHRVPVRREVVMNPIRTIRRLTVMLAGLTGSLLALSTGAPAAFAYVLPPHPSSGGTAGPPPAQAIVTSGMPGWQITLIAAAAAILAATAAVLLDRVRAARRHQTAPSA